MTETLNSDFSDEDDMPLHDAIRLRSLTALKEALTGLSPEELDAKKHVDGKWRSAVHYAASKGELAMVELLLNKGAKGKRIMLLELARQRSRK